MTVPGEHVIATGPYPVRAEPRPCAVCGQPIVAAQLYVVAGPKHVFCDPPRRLDIALVERAAIDRLKNTTKFPDAPEPQGSGDPTVPTGQASTASARPAGGPLSTTNEGDQP